MQPQTEASDLSVCPSFSTYSFSSQLAHDVAAGVRREEPFPDRSRDFSASGAEEDDFEFVSLTANPDREFYIDGGGIRPIFPVFNRDLLLDDPRDAEEDDDKTEEAIRIPLSKLFLDDRDHPSSSSSEADELDGVSPGTYCVWTPKLLSPSPGRCEKSNSTGSSATSKQSRRWRFRDLLKRSNSEGGKGSSLVFLTPAPPSRKSEEKAKEKKDPTSVAGKTKSKMASAHEKFYVRNRKMKEEDKRRSYLPYRQDLVGFFANVNGLGRTFPPF